MKMTGFECYKTYLALKHHFTSETYDYFKYNGKTRANEQTFKTRKDRYFFESMSRKRSDEEILNYFLSNFVYSTDPSKLWIREIIKNGEGHFTSWKRRKESIAYHFENELEEVLKDDIDTAFTCKNTTHSPLLKKHLSGKVSIETLIILDRIFRFKKDYDKTLSDPIWKMVSSKMEKYSPFLTIDAEKFLKIVRRKVT